MVEKRNRLTGEIRVVCALTVCFPYPRHLPIPSVAASDQKVPSSVPWPQRQQNQGGVRDIMCTPTDSEHGDFLDYLLLCMLLGRE